MTWKSKNQNINLHYKSGTCLDNNKNWKKKKNIALCCYIALTNINSCSMVKILISLETLNFLYAYISGLMQDCSNTSPLAMGTLQSCTKLLMQCFKTRTSFCLIQFNWPIQFDKCVLDTVLHNKQSDDNIFYICMSIPCQCNILWCRDKANGNKMTTKLFAKGWWFLFIGICDHCLDTGSGYTSYYSLVICGWKTLSAEIQIWK